MPAAACPATFLFHSKPTCRKRRTVQKQTVEALARLMPPGGRVFLQSDVLEVRLGALFSLKRCREWACSGVAYQQRGGRN